MATYPTEEECNRLLEQYHVPENIVRHSQQVAKIAVFLAQKLNQNGIIVDVGLVRAAGLLHDVAKPSGFNDIVLKNTGMSNEDFLFWKKLKTEFPNLKHNIVAYEIFKDRYPELARIIRCHVFDASIKPYRPVTWEEKIINYADRRVAHDKIVTMSERNSEGEKRWRKNHPDMKVDDHNKEKIMRLNHEIEREIFSIIGMDPERLEIELNNDERIKRRLDNGKGLL